MIQIPLVALPNQSFTFTIDNDFYEISFKLNSNVMCVSITRNDEVVLSNSRCVAGTGLIPYDYLKKGNFLITTLNEEEPDYARFGISQFLLYFTPEEVEASNAGQ